MIFTDSFRLFVKSSAIVTVATLIVNLFGYAFHIFAGRGLGPASYSEITTMIAYSMIFGVPATVATVLIIKRVGQEKSRQAKFNLIQGIEKSFLALFSRPLPLLINYLAIALLGYLTGLAPITYLSLPLFIFIFIFAQLYVALLTAGQLFSTFAISTLIMGIIKLLGAFSAPIFHLLPPVILFLVLASLLQVFYSIFVLRRHYSKNPVNIIQIRTLLSDPSLALTFVSIFGIILLCNADVVLAKRLLTGSEAGLYGAWSLFAKAIAYTFIPLSQVALVYFTDKSKDHLPARRVLSLSALILIVAGLLAYLGFTYLGDWFITLLMGPQFGALIPLLPFAAIFGTLYSLLYLINNYFLSLGSRLALLPAIIALTALIVLTSFGNTLTSFTTLITLTTGISLLIYASIIFLRTTRTSPLP